jgi:PTH1 family peptidyl-tRNA hydrolase
VKSLIGSLGTNDFTRIRIGIDRRENEPGNPVKAEQFVLAPFKRAQKQDVEETVGRAADAVEFIIAEGAAQAMTKYNRRAQGLNTEEE